MPVEFIILLTAVFCGLLVLFYYRYKQRQADLLATVQIVEIENFYSHYLQNGRSLYIYLPPGYHQQPAQRYPVLYLNDGQDRKQLKLHETLATLYVRRLIEPIIVVAIPTNKERFQEYGTAVAATAHGFGKKAALYSRFVTEEIMPIINKGFRTKKGSAATAAAGASLGGLSAFDIAWNHPGLFGTVGVFSGSFWWRAAEDETAVPPGELIMQQIVRRGPLRPGFRAWLEAATRDEMSDRNNNGVIDAIQDTLELIEALESVGYRAGKDVVYVEVKGGRHNYETWSKILPDFLRWAFPG